MQEQNRNLRRGLWRRRWKAWTECRPRLVWRCCSLQNCTYPVFSALWVLKNRQAVLCGWRLCVRGYMTNNLGDSSLRCKIFRIRLGLGLTHLGDTLSFIPMCATHAKNRSMTKSFWAAIGGGDRSSGASSDVIRLLGTGVPLRHCMDSLIKSGKQSNLIPFLVKMWPKFERCVTKCSRKWYELCPDFCGEVILLRSLPWATSGSSIVGRILRLQLLLGYFWQIWISLKWASLDVSLVNKKDSVTWQDELFADALVAAILSLLYVCTPNSPLQAQLSQQPLNPTDPLLFFRPHS